MNSHLLISIGVAGAVACAMAGIALVVRSFGMRTARQRLQEVSGDTRFNETVAPAIMRDMKLSSIPVLNALLEQIPAAKKLDLILAQGDLTIRFGQFVLIMAATALVSGIVATQISHWWWSFFPAAIFCRLAVTSGSVPSSPETSSRVSNCRCRSSRARRVWSAVS